MKTLYSISIFLLSLTACGQNKANISIQESKNKTELKQTSMSNNIENSETNPEKVIKLLITAMSKNDAKTIRSLFHENASQAYGSGAEKSGTAFFSWLESDIIERQGHVENVQYLANSNEVVVTGLYSSKGYTNKADFLFKVEKGKILSWKMRY
ncbi:nuclear transport factor 2 family protein [Xanthomarina sp. GH4-25]|uniref:nuclear transport factor 2 family protein n=1 Tax=Xanthomarina sp. GH4-25 TaxID=3349335 RepID=UPI0038781F8B